MDVTLILITLTRRLFGYVRDLSYRPQRLNTNLLIFGLEVRLAVRISNTGNFNWFLRASSVNLYRTVYRS